MMLAVKSYFAELSDAIGAGWNRFWFTPTPATTLGVVRLLVGALTLYAIATYAPDLERWFAPRGMLPAAMVEELYIGQFSMFDYLPTSMLWPAYWASLAVIALFTLGVGGRVTAILSTVATLSFFGRAPLVTGEFETILAFFLVYLCIGRACDAFSILGWLRPSNVQPPAPSPRPLPSAANTIALRLIQIHLAAVHLLMGWAQLAGAEGSWWTGEGVWLAANRPGMALVDFGFLIDHPRVIAAWSHLVTLYLLALPVFAWIRLARPIVLAVGVLVWASLAVASGLVMFCLAMLVGLVAFVEPSSIVNRQWGRAKT